jgi:hypothetical protein
MTSLYVKCDGCGKELGMEQVWPNNPMPHWSDRWRFVKELQLRGWAERGSEHYCPECVQQPPGEPRQS